ncbi:glycosyltransferase family 61 protein [Natronolimnohabitans innermongolicus]|uniref:glycosyltransferase family 61 protein n=1 Tax=Natronolimnohabitans innermongolicus TaxID=253107 RepID=UPI00126955FD|nr:glycosyltransferase family 61 protein [Natronolimnohabitans innermongolicus]
MRSITERAIHRFHYDGLFGTLNAGATLLFKKKPAGFFLHYPQLTIEDLSQSKTKVAASYTEMIDYSGSLHVSSPANLRKAEGEFEIAERYVYELSESELIGNSPLIRVQNKYLVPTTLGLDTSFGREIFYEDIGPLSAAYYSIAKNKPQNSIESAFLLTSHRTGMPMWLCEILPRVKRYEQFSDKTGIEPRYIIPKNTKEVQKQCLRLLGYDEGDWIEWSGEPTSVKRLFVTANLLRRGHGEVSPSPREIRWLRNRLISATSDIDDKFSNLIYVSREDAERRLVRNETQVMDLLRPFGFERYEPGRYTLREQISMFNNADIIVGPHGAGLSSLLFAENATVIELLSEEGPPTYHFFLLSQELGLDYDFLLCDVVGKGIKPRHKDLVANIDNLRNAIQSISI